MHSPSTILIHSIFLCWAWPRLMPVMGRSCACAQYAHSVRMRTCVTKMHVEQYYCDSCIIVPHTFFSTIPIHIIFPLRGCACVGLHELCTCDVERYCMWNNKAVGATGTALLFHTDAHAHMWNNIACGTKN